MAVSGKRIILNKVLTGAKKILQLYIMSKKEYNKKTKEELIKEVEELRERVEELKKPIDEVTGLYTWIHFLNLAEREFDRSRRFNRPMSVILIDVDHLRKINSDYNEKCGNEILLEVSKRCKDNIRDLDYLGCYEGGKFILLLLEIKKTDAKKVSNRLRKIISGRPVLTQKGPLRVTVSIGVADKIAEMSDISSLLEKADEALFSAKDQGRNRVETTNN
jgi:two-component system chemotaxis family response regulator WspR